MSAISIWTKPQPGRANDAPRAADPSAGARLASRTGCGGRGDPSTIMPGCRRSLGVSRRRCRGLRSERMLELVSESEAARWFERKKIDAPVDRGCRPADSSSSRRSKTSSVSNTHS